jgi:Family of unknown function (DUF6498)
MVPVIQIFAVNLWPAVSVAWFGGSVFTLVLLYWVENLILGAINVAKMLIEGCAGGWIGLIAAAFMAGFFCVHYGFFCYVHGILIWGLFGSSLAHSKLNALGLWAATWQNISVHKVLLWNVILLGAFHLYGFLRYWVGGRCWRNTELQAQMGEPYPRIIIVHFTILIGGFFVMALGQPIWAVVILGLLKTAAETGHLRIADAISSRLPQRRTAS